MALSATDEVVASNRSTETLSLAGIYNIREDILREAATEAAQTEEPPPKTPYSRDERAAPGGPLDHHARSSALLNSALAQARKVLPGLRQERKGVWVLHETKLSEDGWSIATRTGRAKDLGFRGVVSGVRYVPPSMKDIEVGVAEVRVGKQPGFEHSKVTFGAHVAWQF